MLLSRSIAGRSRRSLLKAYRLASTSSSLTTTLGKYPVGSNWHGFTIDSARPVPEFSLVAVLLKHQRSGAQHLHLDAAHDTNNVFSVAFKTNPPNSTGVPHILEHTTLCGSEKYPVRDPFFKMTNRSLANFMNAMTGHDYTYYPFATTNPKDLDNLMDVYLLSVFEPLLEHSDFMQEGWRLENENVADLETPLVIKGVVYNEMKGQTTNSAYYFYSKFLESIYPSLHNSGGDPAKIPDLQYDDLVDFHGRNYHPSNAKTFTYGNLPLMLHLQKLEQYYSRFGSRKLGNQVKQPIFDSPHPVLDVVVPGPVDTVSVKPIENQFKASVTWNLGSPLDEGRQYDIFKWKVLNSLLFDGHNSPFYQELIEKELGDDFAVNTGVDSTTALFGLTIGLEMCSKETAQNMESIIMGVFENQVVPELQNPNSSYKTRIDAILYQIELGLKKHKPHFGLGLLNNIVPQWMNGLDPIKMLEVNSILNQFKSDYAERGLKIFTSLLNDLVFNTSTQKFKFTMFPDANQVKSLEEGEAARIEALTKNLTNEDRKTIFDRCNGLAKKQAEKQNTDVLPTLTMADIPTQGSSYPVSYSEINEDAKMQQRVVETNGLAYVTAAKDISYIPPKYYKYLSLYVACLTNLAGTEKTKITDLETRIQNQTGGISFNVRAVGSPFDTSKTDLAFSFSGMALSGHEQNVYDLWLEILTTTKLDANDSVVVDKLSTLIKNMSQNQINVIADRGNSFASWVSNSNLTPTKYVSDITAGMSQVQFTLELGAKLQQGGKEFLRQQVLPILQEIQKLILDASGGSIKYRAVGNAQLIEDNKRMITAFDSSLSKFYHSSRNYSNELQQVVADFNQGKLGNKADQQTLIDLPFPIGFASLAKLGAPYVSKDGAALQIFSQLLTSNHLHSVIREANGAYGGGLTYDGLGGTLNFYSYRDPNPLDSLAEFKKSFTFGVNHKWSETDLQEAKLRVFQSVDAPMNVASQGASEFIEGITDAQRQERRENFLNVSGQDLEDVVNKYLIDNPANLVTVIGNNQQLKVDTTDGKWNLLDLKQFAHQR